MQLQAEAPLIDPNYWQEPEDLRRGIMGVRLARDILRQPALKPFVVEEISPGPSVVEEPALRDYLRSHPDVNIDLRERLEEVREELKPTGWGELGDDAILEVVAAVSLQETFVRLSEGRRQNWLDGLFASHPPSQERVTRNRETAAQLGTGGELGADRYQARIAPLSKMDAASQQELDAVVARVAAGRAGRNLQLDHARTAFSQQPGAVGRGHRLFEIGRAHV